MGFIFSTLVYIYAGYLARSREQFRWFRESTFDHFHLKLCILSRVSPIEILSRNEFVLYLQEDKKEL